MPKAAFPPAPDEAAVCVTIVSCVDVGMVWDVLLAVAAPGEAEVILGVPESLVI